MNLIWGYPVPNDGGYIVINPISWVFDAYFPHEIQRLLHSRDIINIHYIETIPVNNLVIFCTHLHRHPLIHPWISCRKNHRGDFRQEGAESIHTHILNCLLFTAQKLFTTDRSCGSLNQFHTLRNILERGYCSFFFLQRHNPYGKMGRQSRAVFQFCDFLLFGTTHKENMCWKKSWWRKVFHWKFPFFIYHSRISFNFPWLIKYSWGFSLWKKIIFIEGMPLRIRMSRILL